MRGCAGAEVGAQSVVGSRPDVTMKVAPLTPLRHSFDASCQKDGTNRADPRRHYVCYTFLRRFCSAYGASRSPLTARTRPYVPWEGGQRGLTAPLQFPHQRDANIFRQDAVQVFERGSPGVRIGASEPAIRGAQWLNRHDKGQQRKRWARSDISRLNSDRTRSSIRSSANRTPGFRRRIRNSARAHCTRTSIRSSSRAISRPSVTACDRHTDSTLASRRRSASGLDGSNSASMSAPGC